MGPGRQGDDELAGSQETCLDAVSAVGVARTVLDGGRSRVPVRPRPAPRRATMDRGDGTGVPGDEDRRAGLVFLSTSDTDLIALRTASGSLPVAFGTIDARNPARLGPAGVEALAAEVEAGGAWAVGLRLLGGRKAFPDGFDRLRRACAESGTPLLAWPGEQGRDLELEAASLADPEVLARAGAYLDQGGIGNTHALLRFLSDGLRGTAYGAPDPVQMPQYGIYGPGETRPLTRDEWVARRRPGRPVVAVAFYRAHWMSGNLDFVDELCAAVDAARGEPLPVFCYSPGETRASHVPAAVEECLLEGGRPLCDCLVMTLSFALSQVAVHGERVSDEWSAAWMADLGVPVLQAVTCTRPRAAWEASDGGLAPMGVAPWGALPRAGGRRLRPRAPDVGPARRRSRPAAGGRLRGRVRRAAREPARGDRGALGTGARRALRARRPPALRRPALRQRAAHRPAPARLRREPDRDLPRPRAGAGR